MKKNIFIVGIALLATTTSLAQTTKEEMLETIEKTAGVYYAYPTPSSTYTPTPKGYAPFYISHFGRHGSRYLIWDRDYTKPIVTLEQADKANALSAVGKDALRRLKAIYKEASGRGEDLTTKGIMQHRGIAERMYGSFPEVFAPGKEISARSSVVLRCAMSMAAFGDRLKELNPKLKITYESSRKYMPYLTGRTKEADKFCGEDGAWRASAKNFSDSIIDARRFADQLFSDKSWMKQYIDTKSLMWQMYWVASDLQNMDTDIRLYDLFTEDELFNLWQSNNYEFYSTNANHIDSQGTIKDSFKPLLRNIIESADEAIVNHNIAATLRFAHDGNIVPLAALMGIEDYAVSTRDAATLYTKWCTWKVSPMAANLQIVFYRNKADNILVKVLYNEEEVHIPVATTTFPYYEWTAVRSYYMSIL